MMTAAARRSAGRGARGAPPPVFQDVRAVLVESKPIQQAQILILEGYPTQEEQDLLGPNRGSRRWGVAKERERIQGATAVEARRQGVQPMPPPVRATYTFVVPDRVRRDWDNYALICKPVQDGLVKAGILAGDHYAVLDGRVAFRFEKGARRLEIVLEPAAPGTGTGEHGEA